ncbi:hypothetical protein SIN8267_02943 [Sinobacterium norvegicum]|uniref:Uncharacterized protein n=1 Tax=Sinobacterium norvegicum TaxID=1641715 RepID=A0ABM9AIC8_9GAMM|nr:hypothetical protein SIN8267_02943 [Sinobacterium norvegicum]
MLLALLVIGAIEELVNVSTFWLKRSDNDENNCPQ